MSVFFKPYLELIQEHSVNTVSSYKRKYFYSFFHTTRLLCILLDACYSRCAVEYMYIKHAYLRTMEAHVLGYKTVILLCLPL